MTVFKWKREYVEDIEFNLQELSDDAYWELMGLAMEEVKVDLWFDGSVATYHEAMNDERRLNKTTIELMVHELVDFATTVGPGIERAEPLKLLMTTLDRARKIVADAMPNNYK